MNDNTDNVIMYECGDCGYNWAGDETDSWCPHCDENDIEAVT